MSAASAVLRAARADGYSFAMLTNDEGHEVIRITPAPPKQLAERLRVYRDGIAAMLRAEVSRSTDLRNSAQLGNGQTMGARLYRIPGGDVAAGGDGVTTIEDIGFAAVDWWRMELEWRRRAAANEPANRDAVGQAMQRLVGMLNEYTAKPVAGVNEEDGA